MEKLAYVAMSQANAGKLYCEEEVDHERIQHGASSTDQTSKDQSLYERMQDFRETVKQELSQQASFSALASKRRSSLTIPTDFEDLPPQTFIDTTVIPLQSALMKLLLLL